jgi:hypothetical protein
MPSFWMHFARLDAIVSGPASSARQRQVRLPCWINSAGGLHDDLANQAGRYASVLLLAATLWSGGAFPAAARDLEKAVPADVGMSEEGLAALGTAMREFVDEGRLAASIRFRTP